MSRTALPSQLLTEQDSSLQPSITGLGIKLTAPGKEKGPPSIRSKHRNRTANPQENQNLYVLLIRRPWLVPFFCEELKRYEVLSSQQPMYSVKCEVFPLTNSCYSKGEAYRGTPLLSVE